MTAPAQVQATAADAELIRLADEAYLAWENAPRRKREEMWQRYLDACAVYTKARAARRRKRYLAFFGKETR